MNIPGIYEKRVSESRCYRTTTVRWFGRVTSKEQEYKGGKAPRAPKETGAKSISA